MHVGTWSIRLRRTSVLGLVTVLLGGRAAQADPPVAVDPGLNEPAQLGYQMTAGTALHYQVTTSAQQNLLSFSANRDDSQSLSGTFTLDVGVRQADASGIFLYDEIRGATLQAQADHGGTSVNRLTRALQGTVRGVQMSPTGQVLDEEITPPGDAGDYSPFVESTRALTGLLIQRFQDAQVSVGDTWTPETILSREPVLAGFSSTATLRATFLGYAFVNGRACAALQLDLDVWSTLDANASFEDVSGPGMAHGVGQGYLYFDQTLGVPVLVTMQLGFVGEFSDPTEPVDLTYTQDIRLELQQ